jgi:hypothetical protein
MSIRDNPSQQWPVVYAVAPLREMVLNLGGQAAVALCQPCRCCRCGRRSPGPWLEAFARGSPRPGWAAWGAEVRP